MNESKQVYAAIVQVTSAMAGEGISKDRKNSQQGYSFRGIDDVYNSLSRMLANANLCILPRVLSRSCSERETKNGGALFTVVVDVEFDLVSAVDGSIHTVRTFGEAMDSADKATNKAMSAAYKYMAFQTFAIPVAGDNDADTHTHEVKPKPAVAKSVTQDVWEKMSTAQKNILMDVADAITPLIDTDITLAIGHLDDITDADEKVALWSRFNSKERSAIKKAMEARKINKELSADIPQ